MDNYSYLKKVIYDENYEPSIDSNDPEKQISLSLEEKQFSIQFNIQLNRASKFYEEKEAELYALIEILDNALFSYSKLHSSSTYDLDSIRDDKHSSNRIKINLDLSSESDSVQSDSSVSNKLSDLQEQTMYLYVSLIDLETFIDLNRIALNKIIKDSEKALKSDSKSQYYHNILLESKPFKKDTKFSLIEQIKRTEEMYANAFCRGQVAIANRQLQTYLQNQKLDDQNKDWDEKYAHSCKEQPQKNTKDIKQEAYYNIPCLNRPIRTERLHSAACFLFAIILFIILLNVDLFGNTQENHCFALLLFAAIMWATEAIPLYATSLAIPFLVVLLKVLCNKDGSIMTAKEASSTVFKSMFSGTIMMLLGGFALASGLSKYGIAKAFACHVLSRAGTRPRWVLLAIMCVACFLCMWISNVATPVLCFSLIDPILRTLQEGSNVAPCLLLGIALASCIGGMASPIASPQNIVTLQYMQPSPGWGIWFAVALPISVISILICWIILLIFFQPGRSVVHLKQIVPETQKIGWQQILVILTTLVTIGLWCAESSLENYVGETGVIATIPLFVFFGTGLLNKEDLHAFLWSVVVLAQGGMALGNAVTSSGLLQDIALRIKSSVDHFEPMMILAIFAALILVFSTFVSHTVAALIIVPIVQQVGQQLPIPHPNLLVMGAGLACSAGMGLPVSGYPNMSAIMMEDSSGKPYLTTKDFIMVGVPTSVFVMILIFTLGYGIMVAVGY